MKFIKKLTASVLAVAILAGTTACGAIGGDKSWAVKNKDLTVPIGSYIYYLYASYQLAQSKVTDTSKPVLEQKIENKDAKDWIKEKALTYTKSMLVISDKMKELKLSLTADETKNISSMTDQQWSSVSASLEKLGVAKSSFNLAYSDYYVKYQKVFDALYGKGGKEEVKDDELKTFFEKNYTDFSYFVAPLTNATTGAALKDEEVKKVKSEFDGYAADIKAGKKTIQQAADAYKTSSKQTSDLLYTSTEDLTGSTNYPVEFVTALSTMKLGDVKCIETSGYYVLAQKNDATKKTSTFLAADSSTRNEVLIKYKSDDYTKMIDDLASKYTGGEVNQKAIDSYDPKIFVPAASLSSEPAAAANTQAASSSAEKAESSSATATSSK